MTLLTLTLIGQDRPGLVSTLSAEIAAADGNWLESRMARLAGQFAGILLAEVPDAKVEALIEALRGLEAKGLRLTVERSRGEEPGGTHRTLQLELIGHDRPGIVREIAQALAGRRVNIEELITDVVTGSFSGERMFKASARLRVPDDVATEELRAVLEPLANELMIDLTLAQPGAV
jgi:glycine cleavage system regulatory protein